MIEHRDRLRTRPDERQLIDVDIHRQEELAVGSLGAGDQEHRLQIEQLPVERQIACGGRLPNGCRRGRRTIEVAGFPQPLAAGPMSTTLAHNCGWAPSEPVGKLCPSFVLVTM